MGFLDELKSAGSTVAVGFTPMGAVINTAEAGVVAATVYTGSKVLRVLPRVNVFRTLVFIPAAGLVASAMGPVTGMIELIERPVISLLGGGEIVQTVFGVDAIVMSSLVGGATAYAAKDKRGRMFLFGYGVEMLVHYGRRKLLF